MPDSLIVRPNREDAAAAEPQALLLGLLADGDLAPVAASIDAALDGLLREMRERKEFSGDPNQVVVIPTLGRLPAPRLALVGLGKSVDLTPQVVKQAVASAVRVLAKRGVASVSVDISDLPLGETDATRAVAEGAVLAQFSTDLYRTGEKRTATLREVVVTGGPEAAVSEGRIRGEAKNFARTLVNEPANVLTPVEMANRTRERAAVVGLPCEVLDEAAMEELRMGGILAVTRGSEEPAQFIVMRHHGGPQAEGAPLLALVGKAVCFDTGGISIKPAADMGKMKGDMAGGAAVVGAMLAIAELGLAVNVIGLVPAVINRPDGRSWLPGDVVTLMGGKTAEIISTDAEGRMLLADGVQYARTLGATHIVDIATLTGACAVALGGAAAGLWTTNDALGEAVRRAGDEAGERFWPMPLLPDYKEQIRSDIADLKNSGGRMGGANTAAAFVREFAGDTPWVHLDIAGTSSTDKPKPWAPAGPTGMGVGTFINLAQAMAEEQLR